MEEPGKKNSRIIGIKIGVSKNPLFTPFFFARFLGLQILVEMLVLKDFSTTITVWDMLMTKTEITEKKQYG
jgi:hypothetical protein